MKIYIVLILSAIAFSSWALDRCAVVRAIKSCGSVAQKKSPGDYVCLAYYASRYNSSLNRSPSEYGAFQINSYWWCDDNKTRGRKNLCGMSCKALLNKNLCDDLACVDRIVRDPNGLAAWSAWKLKCKGRDLKRFTAPC